MGFQRPRTFIISSNALVSRMLWRELSTLFLTSLSARLIVHEDLDTSQTRNPQTANHIRNPTQRSNWNSEEVEMAELWYIWMVANIHH
jgi:hypothetical protein